MKIRSIVGLALAVFACFKIVDLLGAWHFEWLFTQPWTEYIAPCIMFYVGVGMFFSGLFHDRDQWLSRTIPDTEEGKRIHCSVSFGGDEYVYNGEHFHGATLDATFGGIRIDLRNAVIDEDEDLISKTGFELKIKHHLLKTLELNPNEIKDKKILTECYFGNWKNNKKEDNGIYIWMSEPKNNSIFDEANC